MTMSMCTTEAIPFVQQGSVEGSGLYQEASSKYGILAQTGGLSWMSLHLIFCRNVSC